VSDERLDELAEMARNRGLKLVRSRVRTPGKRRFGKVGLTDATGKAVFGLDAKGPTAKPDEVEEYLRGLGASDWGASLDAAARVRGKRNKAPATRASDAAPTPRKPIPAATKPEPAPAPTIREAKPGDAPRLVELIDELGHQADETSVRANLAKLRKTGELPLVATLGKRVVGLIGRHPMVTVHRAAPVGRIPVLVVTKEARGQDMGRMLVEAVEQWCREQGCQLIEVTSNDRRGEAHAFYRHLGYERSSIRFFKTL
jgi:GNAT superfamily N-acetyltransferase